MAEHGDKGGDEKPGRSYLGLISLVIVLVAIIAALTYSGLGSGGGEGHGESHGEKAGDGHGEEGASKEASGAPLPTSLDGAAATGAAPALAGETELTRIAFGSCLDQTKPKPILANVLSRRPQLFIWGGDNVYADKRDQATGEMIHGPEHIAKAYETLAASPEFIQFKAAVPFLAAWDDHDYGLNDAGAELSYRLETEALFEGFWDGDTATPRRGREGTYDAFVYGPEGRKVQIILLDTRSFRSGLKPTDEYNAEGKERYLPDPDPTKTMLGAAQWAWLEEQLRQPADVRLIVSSVQIVAEGHGWEAWRLLPTERQKLYDLIKATSAKGVIFVSGDRHVGMLYKADIGVGYPVFEITSSSLNLPLRGWGVSEPRPEPDTQRLDEIIIDENFGVIEIDWAARSAFLELRGLGGELLQGVAAPFGG